MSIETRASATTRANPRTKAISTVVGGPSHVTRQDESGSGATQDSPLVCVGCGQANGAERNFCAGCGQPLRDACPRCGATHARSERFCGQCGLNVTEHYAEQQAHCREILEAARRLKAECRFDDALHRLKEVLKVTDVKLAELAREAQDEALQLHAERLRREQEATQTIEIARNALAGHAIERAIALLEDVPEPLRTSAHLEMLREAKARWKEILGLSGQIRTLIAEKKTLELSGPLERLLALKPDHREAKQLAEQLAGKLIDAARKKMSQREYDDALGLLRRIPAVARPSQAEDLECEAQEAIWLMEHLRRAAYVTPVLAGVAERAARTSPNHPDITRIAAELAQRQRAKPRSPWLAAPEWTMPPQPAAAGAVAHWVGGFSRVTIAEGEATNMAGRYPGRWFVACGLALQGLGRAAADMNLLPQEKGSLWSRLPFGGRRKACESAWGIDLGQSALKAVRMTWDEKRQEACIVEAVFIAAPDAVERDPDGSGTARLALVQQFISDRSFDGQRVCVNLPGLYSLGRWFTVPASDPKKTTAAIEFEAKRQVAFPLDELAWDYEVLDEKSGSSPKADEPPVKAVSMVAAKLHVVQNHLRPWTSAGVNPDVIQSDCVALHNWLRHDHQESTDTLTALIDVGSDSANIIFSGPTMLSFRTVGIGGDEVTKALARQLKLTRPQAEQVKLDPLSSPRLSQFAANVRPVYDQLLGEYQRSLLQLASSAPAPAVDRILCLGGAAASWGLIEVLRCGEF